MTAGTAAAAPVESVVSASRLRALRSALGSGDKPLLLAIHDYPDPDAIAAGMAFQTLARSWGMNAIIAHGGGIGREDNLTMIRLLNIEMRTYASLGRLEEYRGALFLDTQPESKNQSAPDSLKCLGVIDHHHLSPESTRLTPERLPSGGTRVLYSDVRLTVGASSTLALGYLRAAGITPDTRLATALFLGIKTDTDGLLRDAYPADITAYTQLMPLSDLKLASQITHPPMDRAHFVFLHLALSRAMVYGPALIANCGDVEGPDLLSTASDLLVNVKGTEYAVAVGFKGGKAYFSLRTRPPHDDATRVLLKVVGPNGKGGGHGLSAGGFMPESGTREECLAGIRERLLEATGAVGVEAKSLI